MDTLIQPERINPNNCANYRTPSLSGIVGGRYYRATLLSSKNEYLKYPVEVEVCVWEFDANGGWSTFVVRPLNSNGVPILANRAIFENVIPVPYSLFKH